MNKRALLLGGLSIFLFGLVGLMLFSFASKPARGFDPVRPQVAVTPREGQMGGQVREFQLTVGRTRWELAPGQVVEAYAYNGQIPGPEIRVVEGDTLRVTVANALTEPTTIHWHGVEVPAGMDGVPVLSQEPIPPGGSFTYEFVATPAGSRWYHSHFNEMAQQGGGLAGALVIEPREAAPPTPDREYVLVTGQWMAAGAAQQPPVPNPLAPGGMGGMMGPGMMGGMGGMMGGMMGSGLSYLNDIFSVNGRVYPNTLPLLVRQGERVRLRMINAGVTETQVFTLAGHKLRVTHTDGNPLAQPVETEAVALGVGERIDVDFVADNPGRWQLRGLIPGQAGRGLAVDVTYEGHESDPIQGPPPGARFRVARYADFAGPSNPAAPDRTYALTLSGGMMRSDLWTINGRAYPYTRPIHVRQGERVRLRIFNMSMEDHPMHLHGHTFQVVAINGWPVNGPLKDTLNVRHMEEYEIQFVANNPGSWLFHCHNLDHMNGGLMAEVRYR